MVKEFGVRGAPTFFLIDKNGKSNYAIMRSRYVLSYEFDPRKDQQMMN